MAIKPELPYATCHPFKDGLALVRTSKNRYGFIDESGAARIPPRYLEARSFSEGLAAVKTRRGWGFIDPTGQPSIPERYHEVRDFSGGLAAARRGQRWGFIDTQGRWRIPRRFIDARSFSEKRAAVKRRWRYGYVDPQGKLVIKPRFRKASDFSEGLAFVEERLEDSAGYFIDTQGKVVYRLQGRQSLAASFSEGLAPVSVGDHYVSPCPPRRKCSRPEPPRWGYLNRDWKVVIDYRFGRAYPFSGGLALVTRSMDGDQPAGPYKYFIDTKGKMAFGLSEKYRHLIGHDVFTDGLFQIYYGDTMTYIDRRGKHVWAEER